MNKLFSLDDTIYEIVDKHPRALDFLIANGFENLRNKELFDVMSKKVQLRMALKMHQKNSELFCEKLENFLLSEMTSADSNLVEKSKEDADITVSGVLPCPIKIPMMEVFEAWLEKNQDVTIGHDLKSANLGNVDINKLKKGGEDLADVLLSAGFELFLDNETMKNFKNPLPIKERTIDGFDFADPENIYQIIGVIPAIFLVNKIALGDRKMPETWNDLFAPEFENSVALPLSDLDLFNAIVLNIYKEHGKDGIAKLARAYKKSLHPSEMIKSQNADDKPAVSIIPYFFAQMNNSSKLVAVWPKDGAIVSPIFMLSKKEKADELRDLREFFSSAEIGEILSANSFPSTNPVVKTNLDSNQKIKWIGWDFIRKHDLSSLLKQCEEQFNQLILGDKFEKYDDDLMI